MRAIFAGRNIQVAPITGTDFAKDIERRRQQTEKQYCRQTDDRFDRAKKPAAGKQRDYRREKKWMSANGKRSSDLFLAGHKNRAVKESKNSEHSVRYCSRLAVSALELSAAANDHPNESADQRADHRQHK
jgi:hypothetical protein